MLLTVDIGNTHIVLGLYEKDQLLRFWRISSDRKKTEDEYWIILCQLMSTSNFNTFDLRDIAIGSVVPVMTEAWSKIAVKYLKIEPLIVDSFTDTGFEILIDNPKEAGADRIINGVAAYNLYGGPAIIVDFGTATTFDCISKEGAYLGGAIAPGILISNEALFSRAARLAAVSLKRPAHAIGRNTAESLQSGILWGFAGQVDGLVRRMQMELSEKARIIATGGLSGMISEYSETIEIIDPLLTIEGLRIIYERNLKK